MKYTKSHLGVLNEYIYLCSGLVTHREIVCEPLDYYGSRGLGITNYTVKDDKWMDYACSSIWALVYLHVCSVVM